MLCYCSQCSSEDSVASNFTFRTDRNHHGGGVMVRDNLLVHRYFDLETYELLWIELCTKEGPLLFLVLLSPSQ